MRKPAFGISEHQETSKIHVKSGKRINEGNARLYRETNVDTSYMRIPNESSVC